MGELKGVPGHDASFNDIQLAQNASNLLNDHYPGHLWAVFVDSEQSGGVMVIKNLAMSSEYGFVLHLSNVIHDPSLRKVLMAGGEMLERAKMERGRWDGETAEHVDGLPDKYQPTKSGIII